MSTKWTFKLLLTCWLLNGTPVLAGLYLPGKPLGPRVTKDGVKALGYNELRDQLTSVVNIAVPAGGGKVRQEYLERKESLSKKSRSGSLTVDEAISLSECLIRLHEPEEAVALLTPLAARERNDFMLLANLASAHQLAGRLDRALSYLQQVQDVFPREYRGLSSEQLAWYAEVEKYHLKLVRFRYRAELQQARSGGKSQPGLDAIFGDDKAPFQFVGDSGKYEPGKLAPAQSAKLPKNAVAIVQQLLFWIPSPAPGMEETRLYWLLGELYNSRGDIESASQILERCVWSHRYDAPELREHRRLLQEALPPPNEPTAESPGTTDLPPKTGPKWMPNTRRLVIVGSLAGVVVIVLIYLQFRGRRTRGHRN